MSKLQVPYKRCLSLSPGSVVTIHGKPTMSFSNNPKLQVDFHVANDEDSDIAFHFLVCFGDCVEMNSREGGEWKSEMKSYEMPFEDGKPFKLRISVLQNEYQVMVNDKHWYSFSHRIVLRSVEMIKVSRDVSLTSVTICERDG